MRNAFYVSFLAIFASLSALVSVGEDRPVGTSPVFQQYAAVAGKEVPFGPGERWEYQVKIGVFEVGEGHVELLSIDSVRGRPCYAAIMKMKGSVFWGAYKVDDEFRSWFETETLVSRRFIKDHQHRPESSRHYEIYPEELRWERKDKDDGGAMITPLPLDDLAFVYFARTLDLTPGKEYEFSRYFKEKGNPVTLRVLRRETVEVPAGTFETVVVQPIIKTTRLFGEGGEAELYFTDDDRRMMVLMRAKVPGKINLTLHLKSFRDSGTPETEAGDSSSVPPGGS